MFSANFHCSLVSDLSDFDVFFHVFFSGLFCFNVLVIF